MTAKPGIESVAIVAATRQAPSWATRDDLGLVPQRASTGRRCSSASTTWTLGLVPAVSASAALRWVTEPKVVVANADTTACEACPLVPKPLSSARRTDGYLAEGGTDRDDTAAEIHP